VASPPFLNSSGLPSSAESGRDPYISRDRHQKVLLSNLGLTVFVKYLVKWVCLREKNSKRGKDLNGLLHFCPLLQQTNKQTKMPSDAPFVFIENIFVTLDI
jgi:hypothetical protein